MRQQVTDPAEIEAEIERLRSCALHALRRRWRLMFGRTPPAALSKALLVRDGLARQAGPRPRQLKVGTVLVRDHRGQRHTVTIARDGFQWHGTTYSSLSAIARAITGTAWSGPRFFGLRPGADDRRKHKSTDQRAPDQHRSIKTCGAGAQRVTASNPPSPAPRA